MMRRVVCLFGFLVVLAGAAADQIPHDLDQDLRALWRGMVGRLLSGDTEGAISYFSPEMQFYYRRKLEDLKGHLPSSFSRRIEIEPGYLEGNRAFYRLSEREESGEVTLRIWFRKDPDGTWRIESF